MKNEGPPWSSSFTLSKFCLKKAFPVRRAKNFPSHQTSPVSKLCHFNKWSYFQNENFIIVLWKYGMEIQIHSCSVKQIVSVGNWYLHHSKNAGKARKAGTFHGNLKTHPDSQHMRNNECLHFHWFVCWRISIHYVHLFEKEHIKVYHQDLILWVPEILTYKHTQHDYCMLRLIFISCLMERNPITLSPWVFLRHYHIMNILDLKMIKIQVNFLYIFASV